MEKININIKPSGMSNLYWDYLKGRIKEENLSDGQIYEIALEKWGRYKERGGKQSFIEFLKDIEITGL